ncbi:MAG: glycosyltransferase family 9 protein [Verrucomicrobiae bacterium]|nr:glycosyltransferase family 9 protein [Verrucomicrobiae bacterium]
MDFALPQRIVVFCLPGIGDAVLFTPALRMLRRAFPNARILAVTMFRGTYDILLTNPHVDEVRHFDFFHARLLEGLRYVWGLRREGFDLSIMPFPSNRREYNVVNWLVGRRWRAGHRYRHHNRRNLYFLNNIVVRENGSLHNVEENLRLVRAICERIGVPVPLIEAQPQTELVLTAADEQAAEAWRRSEGIPTDVPWLGLHTYSSTFKNMHRKCWPKEKFVELIRELSAAHPQIRFLVFSGPSDREVNAWILQQVRERVHLVERPNLREALVLLRRCRVFVSNDSGLMHLAAAVGVAVVALFGPTDWRRLHPWTAQYVVVRRDLPCMPCFYYSRRPLQCRAGLDYACMREIEVRDVMGAVERLLQPASVATS